MEEVVDEDGAPRVPNCPSGKEKDDLNDLASSNAGPALGPLGKTEEVHLPEAFSEESRPHKAVSNPDVDPESVLNPDVDPGSAVLNPGDVAGAVGNPDGIGPVADPNPGDVVPGVFGNLHIAPEIVENLDVAPGVVGNPGDVSPEIVENLDVAPGVVENPGVALGREDSTDEGLWCKAIEEGDCEELEKLLAKDVSYFWKYEKKNSMTALHAAATKGDLMLAELVLDMLSWAEETQGPVLSFRDSELRIDEYIAAKTTSGKTAEEVAQENNQAGIKNKILDYIANETQRRTFKERSMAESGSSKNQRVWPENLEWNEAIKKKDCQALLTLLQKDEEGQASNNGYKLLELDVSKAKSDLKYGKGECQTMFHVAAMQGCFPLAKLVLDMLRRRGGGSRGLYIQAVDDLSGLTAFEMANDIIGNRSISEYVKYIYGSIKHKLQVKTENDKYRIPSTESFDELISFEAYPDTRWYMALERGHTKELKKLLELNSRFVLETCHGMTVLHVAILWDDLELVKAVVKLFEDSKQDTKEINWGDSYYPSSLKLKDMIEVARSIDHRHMNEYWDALSRHWEALAPGILKQLKRGGNSCSLLAKLLERREIVAKLSERRKTEEESEKSPIITSITMTSTPIVHTEECSTPTVQAEECSTPIVHTEEYSTMPLRLQIFFKETWEKSPQWKDEEFRKDVDFNFEDSKRQGWLKFHYACKDPVKFKGLLQEMASFINRHPYDGIKLFQTWDAKGRTPFHILMDHYSDQQDPGWPFDEIFIHKCYKDWIQIAENARGKRIIDMALTKNYLQRNINLEPWKYFNLDLQHEKFERSEITTLLYYQVAYLLKQKIMAEEIWSSFLEKRDMKNIMKKYQDEFKSMLLIAACTGNQTCLQLLLETHHDPMITDTQGRSLLHHAADPTLLLSQLVGKCSLTTVEDVREMKKKWSEGTTTYSPQSISSNIANHDGSYNATNSIHSTTSSMAGLSTSKSTSSKTSNSGDLTTSNSGDLTTSNSSNSTTSHSSGTSILNSSSSFTSNSNTQDLTVAERSNVGRKGCILMLLQAGVDLGQSDKDNKVPSIGPTIDATYQSWWYDTVVKDSTDKRNAYSQAGNALSVVGTLVAATSYIGPLQPPLSYDTSDSGSIGFVKTTEPLIKAFMVSTSVAFYFAMASVMFAVVSSLPMPQEGVMGELKRAKHVVSFSLCLLLIAIGSIIVSFATASIVAIQNEHSFHSTDLLFVPSIIGWFFCFLGIGGFFIRVARLIFYKDPIIRRFYQFSYERITFKCLWVIVLCLYLLVSFSLYVPVYIVYRISDLDSVPFGIWSSCWTAKTLVKSFLDDARNKLKLELRHLVCGCYFSQL
ncbi:hypothetical protein M758_12G163200 [Ceratodon purpureus]|nr:hypothetical protein M758_12G163200 [Ceratodon purpureus]